MATTFNFRPERGQGPLYRQLASYFRQEIREGRLLPLEFLPSIRKLNRDLKLSRTTATRATSRTCPAGATRWWIPGGFLPLKRYGPSGLGRKKRKKRLLCSIIFLIITLIRPPSIRCCGGAA